MPTIDIVLSPALWSLADAKDANVVVIDIFRATSTIAAALQAGATAVHPVKAADEALALGKKGYLTAGERDGKPLEGFDFGNSPVLIQGERIKGQKLALTTTNGTKCFEMAQTSDCHAIYSGSFLNIRATAERLLDENRNIILFCAGWKDLINLEDTLYAGALYAMLQDDFSAAHDAVLLAENAFDMAKKKGVKRYLKVSSHFQRLKNFGAERDMELSLKHNTLDRCVVLKDDELVLSILN